MSGRIVHEPVGQGDHRCTPPFSDGEMRLRPHPFYGWKSSYEKGTVWECSCGRTWVSSGRQWHPEGRFARWRRERRNRHQQHSGNGTVVLDPVNAPTDVLPPSAAIVTQGQQKPHRQPPQTTSQAKPPPPPPRGSR